MSNKFINGPFSIYIVLIGFQLTIRYTRHTFLTLSLR